MSRFEKACIGTMVGSIAALLVLFPLLIVTSPLRGLQ